MLAVAVIISNYFHDLAAGVLLGAAVAMWAVERAARTATGSGLDALRRVYPALSKLALGAVVWIVVGGIPRTIFFSRFEYDPAVVKGIVTALAVKHVLFFVATIAGAVLWRRMRNALERGERAAAPEGSGRDVSAPTS